MHAHHRRFRPVRICIAAAALASLAGWASLGNGNGSTSPGQAMAPSATPITEQQVNAAQQAWCDGLVKVALAYFVGGNPSFPEDTGFALKGWTKARYDNNASENGIQIHGDIAITMGNVYVTGADGKEIMVDKTFVFRRCKDGNLRLCVHKSALPYSPN